MLSKALYVSGALVFAMGLTSCVAQTSRSEPQRGAKDASFNFKIVRTSKTDPAKAGKCRKGAPNCYIEVTVVAGGGKCKITANPEYAVITDPAPVDMVWEVTTRGWTFDPKMGITWENAPPSFHNVAAPVPTMYGWRIKDQKKNWYYAYRIYLLGPDNTKCDVDPGVVTEWP